MRIGEWQVDADANTIRRGDKAHRLEPRVMALLMELAGQPSKALTRSHLLSVVWAGRIVEDDALSQAVIKLRKALGDSAKRPAYIETIPKVGYRLVAEVDSASAEPRTAVVEKDRELRQEIRYCRSADGTPIAYAEAGQGSPLLRAPTFMTHLEYDWQGGVLGPFLRELARRFHFVRFDQRGNGLSDRHPKKLSLQAFVDDMKAVADAAEMERFPVYAMSQGGPIAIKFAIDYPERVSALVLHGAFARGRFLRMGNDADALSAQKALVTLMRAGWGQENPAFRQLFSTMFMPDGTPELFDSYNESMRVATAPDVAARIFETSARMDVTDCLAKLDVPTLVLHARRDAVTPFDEGRQLAAMIPGARLVELDTSNHVPIAQDPAMLKALTEIVEFLQGYAASG